MQAQVVHTIDQIITEDAPFKLSQLQSSILNNKNIFYNSIKQDSLFINDQQQSFDQNNDLWWQHHQQHNHNQIIQNELNSDWKLLLPCAINSANNNELRWFYQAPFAKHLKPLSIEQFAINLNINIINHSSQQANPSNNSSSSYQQHYNYNNNLSSNNNSVRIKQTAGAPGSRIIIGPSYLAIEWPRKEQSGRYVCNLIDGDSFKTMCDINVIIRQPIKLKLINSKLSSPPPPQSNPRTQEQWPLDYSTPLALNKYNDDDDYQQQQQQQVPVAVSGPQDEKTSWLFRAAADWFGVRKQNHQTKSTIRNKRVVLPDDNIDGQRSQQQQELIQVRGRGLIKQPTILMVGQRLQLQCLASGYPIDNVRWFRDGQQINTQSSNDFQIEIQTNINNFQPQQQLDTKANEQQSNKEEEQLLSTLIIRQLQPKNVGFIMFECFAQNSAGDRARAGLPVFVVERHLIDWARANCPLPPPSSGWWLAATEAGSAQQSEPAASSLSNNYNNSSAAATIVGDLLDYDYVVDGGGKELQQAGQLDSAPFELASIWRSKESFANFIFKRYNPLRRALLIESEPFELICPNLSGLGKSIGFEAAVDLEQQQRKQQQQQQQQNSCRVDWRRWGK